MKKVKIQGKEYNCSNIVYWHIKGLEGKNKVLSLEIKGHEKSELKLQQRIDKALDKITNLKEPLQLIEVQLPSWLDELEDVLRGEDNE